MKILITSGNGFIAQNLSQYLRERCYDVEAPPKSVLDLTNNEQVKDYFKEHRFDTIVHISVYDAVSDHTTKDRNDIIYQNLVMFFNLVENKSKDCRLISLGSGGEYDKRFWDINLTEEDFGKHIPIDPYGFAKYTISKYAELQDIIILRLFGVYGPHDNWRAKFIAKSCARVLCDLPIYIRKNRKFDYLYVEDLCTIIERFIIHSHHVGYSAYNVCTGTPIWLSEIARYIVTHSRKDACIITLNSSIEQHYSGNNSRLLSKYPDLTFTSIYEGINKTYNRFLNNPVYDIELLKQQEN